eukprot:1031957-Amphidinium_carterae.2
MMFVGGDLHCASDSDDIDLECPPPSVGPTPAPSFTSLSGPLSLSSHLGHTNCASQAHGEAAYVPPSFTPSVQVTSCSGSEELKRDRSKLPRCDVHVDSYNPAASIHELGNKVSTSGSNNIKLVDWCRVVERFVTRCDRGLESMECNDTHRKVGP